MHRRLRRVGTGSHHGARAWFLALLQFSLFFGSFSEVSGTDVIRTLTQLDLIADSASVIGVGADGLTTFRVFEDDVYDGSSTSTLTQTVLANSVLLIQSDTVVSEVDSCDLTSTLAGFIQCVGVSPDSSGHLQTETFAGGVGTLLYTVNLVVSPSGDNAGGPGGAATSSSPSASLTGVQSSKNPSSTIPSSSSQSASSESEAASPKKSNVGTVIGVIFGSILFLIILLLLLLYFLRKHRLQKSQHIRPLSLAPSFVEPPSKFDRPPTLTPFRVAAYTGGVDDLNTGIGSVPFHLESLLSVSGIGAPSRHPERHRPEPLNLDLTEKGMGWNPTVTLAPPTPPPKAKEAWVAAGGPGTGTELLPIIATATATTTATAISSPPAHTNPLQPTSTAKRSTDTSARAVRGPPPQSSVPSADNNHVLIEAMYHLQERLASLENQVDPAAGSRSGKGGGMVGDLERQAPPTYVA